MVHSPDEDLKEWGGPQFSPEHRRGTDLRTDLGTEAMVHSPELKSADWVGHISARSPKRHRDTDLRTDLGNIRAKMGSGFQFGAAGKEARKVSRELEVRAHFARDRST